MRGSMRVSVGNYRPFRQLGRVMGHALRLILALISVVLTSIVDSDHCHKGNRVRVGGEERSVATL